MTELDKSIKMIYASSIDELFDIIENNIEDVENIMKTDAELSYFFLGRKLKNIKSAMNMFKDNNNLKK